MTSNLAPTLSAADARASISRLRRALVLFAVLLLLPMSLVFGKAYQQIQDETFLQYRNAADALLSRMNKRLDEMIATEEQRPFRDYSADADFSPLATFPPPQSIPGLVGYFQIDPSGKVESPLVPSSRQLAMQSKYSDSLPDREAAFARVVERLNQAGVASKAKGQEPAPTFSGYAALPKNEELAAPSAEKKSALDDALKETVAQQSLSSLNLDNSQLDRYERSNKLLAKVYRKADAVLRKAPPRIGDELEASSDGVSSDFARSAEQKGGVAQSDLAVDEPEVDPFQLIARDDLTFVLQRKVWRNRARYIQGFVIDGRRFLDQTLREIRGEQGSESNLSLVVAKSDQALHEVAPVEDRPATLLKRGMSSNPYLSSSYEEPEPEAAAVAVLKGRLVAPFDSFDLLAALPRGLPTSPSFSVILMLGAAILSTLAVGLVVIYRMSLSRIHLAQKKSDFVSSVSHELRTPLTSIRMYAEMLRDGYVADEEKKQSYYDFIFSESERLSRLISNVLQLSRISTGERTLTLTSVTVNEALSLWEEKVRSQAERAGFAVEIAASEPALGDAKLSIESDAFAQIGINLVDNAIKFSRNAAEKRVVLGARLSPGSKREVMLYIRDFGQGVPPHEQRRIFELFYRAESELTRETPGTGIGLALVRDLAKQLNARVDMSNQSPGAEFQIYFQLKE